MESLKNILQDSGAEIFDPSGRKIHLDTIQHKVDTNNKLSAIHQELLELSSEEQSEWLCYHKLIGNKYYRCGNINKATEVYMDTLMAAKILKDDHTTVSVLCNLASCLIFQAQAAPAISLLNQALAITPGFPRALERRAAAYNLIGKIEEAEADLKTGINTVHEKTLENKMKNMLEKIQIDKRKKKEMYKKMIEPKKNIIIPDWVTKIIQLTIIPFTLINKLKSFCKRKQS